MFVWRTFCSSSTKDSLVRFIEVLSFHLICNVKTYHKWVTEDNLLSTFFSYYFALISSCKIKAYKHVFSQIQIVFITCFCVCTHTCSTMCENQRTNYHTSFHHVGIGTKLRSLVELGSMVFTSEQSGWLSSRHWTFNDQTSTSGQDEVSVVGTAQQPQITSSTSQNKGLLDIRYTLNDSDSLTNDKWSHSFNFPGLLPWKFSN